MIPWIQIDKTQVPGAEVELSLMRRGTEFSMKLGHNELMNSRLSGSEEALATLACKRIELTVGRDLQYIRINGTLVGGLVGLLIFTATRWF